LFSHAVVLPAVFGDAQARAIRVRRKASGAKDQVHLWHPVGALPEPYAVVDQINSRRAFDDLVCRQKFAQPPLHFG
jgi:hypothetical protein